MTMPTLICRILVIVHSLCISKLLASEPLLHSVQDTPAGIRFDVFGSPVLLEGLQWQDLKNIPAHLVKSYYEQTAAFFYGAYAGTAARNNPALYPLLRESTRQVSSLSSIYQLWKKAYFVGHATRAITEHVSDQIQSQFQYWTGGHRRGFMPIYVADPDIARVFHIRMHYPDDRLPYLQLQCIHLDNEHQPEPTLTGWQSLIDAVKQHQIHTVNIEFQALSTDLIVSAYGQHDTVARLQTTFTDNKKTGWYFALLKQWQPDFVNLNVLSVFEPTVLDSIAQALSASMNSPLPVTQTVNPKPVTLSARQRNASLVQVKRPYATLSLVHSNYGETFNRQQGAVYYASRPLADANTLLSMANSDHAEAWFSEHSGKTLFKQPALSFLLSMLHILVVRSAVDTTKSQLYKTASQRWPQGVNKPYRDSQQPLALPITSEPSVQGMDHSPTFHVNGASRHLAIQAPHPASSGHNQPNRQSHPKQQPVESSRQSTIQHYFSTLKMRHKSSLGDEDEDPEEPGKGSVNTDSITLKYSELEDLIQQLESRYQLYPFQGKVSRNLLDSINRFRLAGDAFDDETIAQTIRDDKSLTDALNETFGKPKSGDRFNTLFKRFDLDNQQHLWLFSQCLKRPVWVFTPTKDFHHLSAYVDPVNGIALSQKINEIQPDVGGREIFLINAGQHYIRLVHSDQPQHKGQPWQATVIPDPNHQWLHFDDVVKPASLPVQSVTPAPSSHQTALETMGLSGMKNNNLYITKNLLALTREYWLNNPRMFYDQNELTTLQQRALKFIKDYSIDLVSANEFPEYYLHFSAPWIAESIVVMLGSIFKALRHTLQSLPPGIKGHRIAVYGGVARIAHLTDKVFYGSFPELRSQGLHFFNDIDLMVTDSVTRDQFLTEFTHHIGHQYPFTVKRLDFPVKGLHTHKLMWHIGHTRVFSIDVSYSVHADHFNFQNIEALPAIQLRDDEVVKLPVISHRVLLEKLHLEAILPETTNDARRRIAKAREALHFFHTRVSNLTPLSPEQNSDLRELAIKNIPAYRHSHAGGNPPRIVDPLLRGDDDGINLPATSIKVVETYNREPDKDDISGVSQDIVDHSVLSSPRAITPTSPAVEDSSPQTSEELIEEPIQTLALLPDTAIQDLKDSNSVSPDKNDSKKSTLAVCLSGNVSPSSAEPEDPSTELPPETLEITQPEATNNTKKKRKRLKAKQKLKAQQKNKDTLPSLTALTSKPLSPKTGEDVEKLISSLISVKQGSTLEITSPSMLGDDFAPLDGYEFLVYLDLKSSLLLRYPASFVSKLYLYTDLVRHARLHTDGSLAYYQGEEGEKREASSMIEHAAKLGHPVAIFIRSLCKQEGKSEMSAFFDLKSAAVHVPEARPLCLETMLNPKSPLFDPGGAVRLYQLASQTPQYPFKAIKHENNRYSRRTLVIDHALTLLTQHPDSAKHQKEAVRWMLTVLPEEVDGQARLHPGVLALFQAASLQDQLPDGWQTRCGPAKPWELNWSTIWTLKNSYNPDEVPAQFSETMEPIAQASMPVQRVKKEYLPKLKKALKSHNAEWLSHSLNTHAFVSHTERWQQLALVARKDSSLKEWMMNFLSSAARVSPTLVPMLLEYNGLQDAPNRLTNEEKLIYSALGFESPSAPAMVDFPMQVHQSLPGTLLETPQEAGFSFKLTEIVKPITMSLATDIYNSPFSHQERQNLLYMALHIASAHCSLSEDGRVVNVHVDKRNLQKKRVRGLLWVNAKQLGDPEASLLLHMANPEDHDFIPYLLAASYRLAQARRAAIKVLEETSPFKDPVRLHQLKQVEEQNPLQHDMRHYCVYQAGHPMNPDSQAAAPDTNPLTNLIPTYDSFLFEMDCTKLLIHGDFSPLHVNTVNDISLISLRNTDALKCLTKWLVRADNEQFLDKSLTGLLASSSYQANTSGRAALLNKLMLLDPTVAVTASRKMNIINDQHALTHATVLFDAAEQFIHRRPISHLYLFPIITYLNVCYQTALHKESTSNTRRLCTQAIELFRKSSISYFSSMSKTFFFAISQSSQETGAVNRKSTLQTGELLPGFDTSNAQDAEGLVNALKELKKAYAMAVNPTSEQQTVFINLERQIRDKLLEKNHPAGRFVTAAKEWKQFGTLSPDTLHYFIYPSIAQQYMPSLLLLELMITKNQSSFLDLERFRRLSDFDCSPSLPCDYDIELFLLYVQDSFSFPLTDASLISRNYKNPLSYPHLEIANSDKTYIFMFLRLYNDYLEMKKKHQPTNSLAPFFKSTTKLTAHWPKLTTSVKFPIETQDFRVSLKIPESDVKHARLFSWLNHLAFVSTNDRDNPSQRQAVERIIKVTKSIENIPSLGQYLAWLPVIYQNYSIVSLFLQYLIDTDQCDVAADLFIGSMDWFYAPKDPEGFQMLLNQPYSGTLLSYLSTEDNAHVNELVNSFQKEPKPTPVTSSDHH